jgi:hypothetical protein
VRWENQFYFITELEAYKTSFSVQAKGKPLHSMTISTGIISTKFYTYYYGGRLFDYLPTVHEEERSKGYGNISTHDSAQITTDYGALPTQDYQSIH